MQWFPGNVETAIQISRKNNALLIVYISTEDEKGQQFENLWENIDSQNLGCAIVGIKLKKGSDSAFKFAEIYPTPILPAAFLIDQKGTPLEIITHLVPLNNDSFRQKINKAVQEFLKTSPSSAAPVKPVETNPTPVANQNQAVLDEKIKKAKELLEQKKKIDAEKKIEEEKQNELRRIQEAKSLQEVKRERDDKALIEAAKERRKEKLETEKEKERIRAQIKADREDRLRAQKPSQDAEKSKPEAPTQAPIPSDRCRLQVRLPDGSVLVEEFSSSDNLLSLIEIIKQKTSIKGSFDISQLYPRKIFTAEELGFSFLKNALTPSASLIIIQKPGVTVIAAKQTGYYISLLTWLLFSPFNFIFKTLTSIFGGGSQNDSNSGETNQPSTSSGTGTGNGNGQRGMPRTAEVRRRGNISGLHNPNGDDPEERANFNGNSTQFM
ncbi:unnamed protein product [Caenorhabditis angaria]|uniref:UBX domain-containing protein 4 n=1 Tax=Caenorhabditis angaria TaxID=860376 RepID=A0A9P1IIT9_9PELO|nr:unnamed protein product [Caenorhabditis angaria]